MDNKKKQIVNEAIAIIAGECKKNNYCKKCVFWNTDDLYCCFDFIYPKNWEKPFKTKKESHWLSGKEKEVIDDGR